MGTPLYAEHASKDTARTRIGRELFEQFNVVVMLDEQVRVQDGVWTDILSRLRVGECTDNDLAEISKLDLSNKDCEPVDFQSSPWNEAVLVTTRHAVREQWNHQALKRHCSNTGNRRYIFDAEDTGPSGRTLTNRERLAVASMESKSTGKVTDRLEIAIGMKAMVLLNLATEADIANGTRGTVVDIILDPREDRMEEDKDGTIHLHYPPALIMFKPDKGSVLHFEGVTTSGLVPIIPHRVTFTTSYPNGRGGQHRLSVTRRQYALTAGYAFTDYKSQGQTIEYVIIDLCRPPNGCLSPFNAYVALSRSRGRKNIRLLRGFDEQLFLHHPSESLRRDMQRLTLLAEATRVRYPGSRS